MFVAQGGRGMPEACVMVADRTKRRGFAAFGAPASARAACLRPHPAALRRYFITASHSAGPNTATPTPSAARLASNTPPAAMSFARPTSGCSSG